MTTLVKADSKGRVPIRGTKKSQQYLVTSEGGGWWVMPAPKVTPPPRGAAKLVRPLRAPKGRLLLPVKIDRAALRAAIRQDRDER